ncbi:hypothetical protein I4U23_011831 [Adineta vaga]|nr:hypothetical protein I4U23_011831 [Adineta vaga]
MDKSTNLLSLPNELFLNNIFIYLHSIDLLNAFGHLENYRLNSLLYSYIHHLDLLTTDTSVVLINRWLFFLSFLKTDTILSLRINPNHFDYSLSSIFPRLNRLDLQMTEVCESISQILVSTRLKSLSITLTSEKPERIKGLTSFIWHFDSCLESLITSNCFILDKDDLYSSSSSSLMINRNLTRLSLDLAHICFAIILMPFVPALEHFELRLHNIYNQSSALKSKFLQEREWPTKVRLLRFIAHDQLMDTTSFCDFVKRFSLSLEYLSFYISTGQRFLMATRRTFEIHLLDYLPNLKSIDFCVHSGLLNFEIDRRHTFDHWTKKQIISIYYSRQYLTRMTIPFTFNRLEYVSNEFIDYHCNYNQSNFILSFSSIVMITFFSYEKLHLTLFTFIQQTCPSLNYLRFKKYCNLDDDLILNTKLIFSTVTKLCLSDVTSIDHSILCCLLSLTPNLKYLTARQCHLTTIDTNMLEHLLKITIIKCNSYS